MESSILDADWIECFTKSGELLFCYNKVTTEHRWPNYSSMMQSIHHGIDHCWQPLRTKETVSAGIQTEDYGCNSGCSSVYVNGCLNYPSTDNQSGSHSVTAQAVCEKEEPLGVKSVEFHGEAPDKVPLGGNMKFVFVSPIDGNIVEHENSLRYCSSKTNPPSSDSLHTEAPNEDTLNASSIENNVHVIDVDDCNNNGSFEEITESDFQIPDKLSTTENIVNSNDMVTPPDEIVTELEEKINCGLCGMSIQCPVCQSTCRGWNYLLGHLHIHMKTQEHKKSSESLKCWSCNKTFTFPSGLKRHELSHSGVKPHQCQTCGKTFKQQVHLKVHEQIHTDVKPFQCVTCGKCFLRHSNLKRHYRFHSGVRPYQCQACGKAYKDNRGLKGHECIIHTGVEGSAKTSITMKNTKCGQPIQPS